MLSELEKILQNGTRLIVQEYSMLQGKKILFVTPRFFYPPNDGAKIVFFWAFKYLSDNNEIDVISNISTNDKKYIPYIQNKVKKMSCLDFDVKKQHLFLLLRSLFTRTSYLYLKYFRQAFIDKLDEFLGAKEYDIIWIESSYMSFFAPHIKEKYPNVKVFIRSHNVEFLLLQRIHDETKNPIKRFLLKREIDFMKIQEVEMMKKADKIFTISLVDRKMFMDKDATLEAKLVMLYPVVDFTKYKKSLVPSEKNIVFIGSMDYLPNAHGIEWFVDKVFPEVEKAHPDVKLYIVGNGMPKSFHKWKQKTNIILDAWVKEDTYYYDLAQIFICPLFSWSWIKIKIINAFATGKAILSTTVWTEGLDVIDKKHIFIWNTQEEWIQSLNENLWRQEVLQKLWDEWNIFANDNFNPNTVFSKLEM